MRELPNVLILGNNSLAAALRKLCSDSGRVQLSDGSRLEREMDVIVETTNADLAQKRANLASAETYAAGGDTLILSTVLGISATESASWLQDSTRLVGFSAFATIEKSELVEIAPALQTEESKLRQAARFFEALGKQTETVQDEVGLVYARILSLIINEAAFGLMEGIASPQDIDTAMRQGTNYPMGPLEWADTVGVDDIVAVLNGLHREIGEDRYRPAPLLRKLLYAKRLGLQSGRGFYTYPEERKFPS
ncbi:MULTISPECIES: 3-hydroxyacyl-CoA dehydrogenase family protein [Paenibacillus]|uniref:3-hydroxybutyryl-CoA dehydrogenase n=1 Tax=Paenibacillus validus TaxID=44253 RepID=A0A7X2Z6Q3_9BACL|nr:MULTISPECIES: 3-hydroxyacyl-CoA dehydrogenase family protein [Paenibacillus]MUG69360.1 3-hydroxybutyryl-CoA dehydrogenase [Paenibacillus validus]